jgi:hypothetical protein
MRSFVVGKTLEVKLPPSFQAIMLPCFQINPITDRQITDARRLL